MTASAASWAEYKRRKTEESSARSSLSGLKRGGEDFIDLKHFTAPAVTRPPPTPSSSLFSSRAPATPPPWMSRTYGHRNFTLRLHEELLDFAAFISPTSAEERQRAALLSRFTSLIESLFPSASLSAFGSYSTKLYLPMSDIDVVVFDSPEIDMTTGDTALEVIASALRREGWASYLEVISNARIPIVKFTDKETGLKVDVCRDQSTGLQAAQFISTMTVKFPAFRPLILFLKYFLWCRQLSDTYTGGIGSYLLQLLLLSHLHFHPSQTFDVNLGLLLLSFLDMYGHQLNYAQVGLSLSPPSYYSKESRNRLNLQRPNLLSVENPLDVEHDVGVNSFCVMKVRRAFQYGFAQLTRREVMEGEWDGSLLALLVRAEEPTLVDRGEKKQREMEKRRANREEMKAPDTAEDKTESKESAVSTSAADEEDEMDDDGEEEKDEDLGRVRRQPLSSSSPPASASRATKADEEEEKKVPASRAEKLRYYQEVKNDWLKMSSKAAMKYLKDEGFNKGERAKLRQFRKPIKKKAKTTAAPPASKLLDWYRETETDWMDMPLAEAHAWLKAKGMSRAERKELETLHPERVVRLGEQKEREEKKEGKEREEKHPESSLPGKRDSAATAATRPVWLDFSRSRFKEFLDKEVVVKSVQHAMTAAYRAERQRMRLRNPDLVQEDDERGERRKKRAAGAEGEAVWKADEDDAWAANVERLDDQDRAEKRAAKKARRAAKEKAAAAEVADAGGGEAALL